MQSYNDIRDRHGNITAWKMRVLAALSRAGSKVSFLRPLMTALMVLFIILFNIIFSIWIYLEMASGAIVRGLTSIDDERLSKNVSSVEVVVIAFAVLCLTVQYLEQEPRTADLFGPVPARPGVEMAATDTYVPGAVAGDALNLMSDDTPEQIDLTEP